MFATRTTVFGPHGIPIHVETIPGIETMSVRLIMFAGSADEDDPAERGVHHWLEHCVFRGTPSFPQGELSRAHLSRQAGTDGAGTSTCYTTYRVNVVDSQWRDGLRSCIEMVAAPLLRDEDIDAERQIILKEIAGYWGDPEWGEDQFVRGKLFGEHPLGRDPLGSKTVLETASTKAVRALHAKQYSWSRAVLCVSSSLPPEVVAEFVTTLVNALPLRVLPIRRAPAQFGRALWKPMQVREVSTREATSVHIHLPLLTTYSDVASLLEILWHMLMAGGLSGPLMKTVREERNLVYDLDCGLALHPDERRLIFSAETTPGKEVALIGAIRDSLGDNATYSNDRYEWVRDYLNALKKFRPMSTILSVDDMCAQVQAGLFPQHPDEKLSRLLAVPHDAVVELIHRLHKNFERALMIVFTPEA